MANYDDQRLRNLKTFISVAKNINGNTQAILPNNNRQESIKHIIFEIEKDIKLAKKFELELINYVILRQVNEAIRPRNLRKDLVSTLGEDNVISANAVVIKEEVEGVGEEEGDSKEKSAPSRHEFVVTNYNDIKMTTPGIDMEQMINEIIKRWLQRHKPGVVEGLNERYESLSTLLKERLSWSTNLYDKTYKIIAKTIEKRDDWENVKKEYEINIGELLSINQSGGKKSKKLPKKEILGKMRCIYKIPGDRKEYLKHKGKLITVKEYKELMKAKPKKKEAKPKKVKKPKSKK